MFSKTLNNEKKLKNGLKKEIDEIVNKRKKLLLREKNLQKFVINK